jgi:hypothetical protein
MKHNSWYAVIVIGVAVSAGVRADETNPLQPTAEQLKAAQEAYAKVGGTYAAKTHPVTGQTVHQFLFRGGLGGGDLTKLPDLPFPYGWTLGGDRSITDASLNGLKGRKWLISVHLYNTKITDAGLKEFKDLPNLAHLALGETAITDEGLEHLKGLKSLAQLGIYGTMVTDAGMKHLLGLTELRWLMLGKTKVTTAGLRELKPLSKLARLDLDGAQMNDETLKVLREIDLLHALINCHYRNQAPASDDEIVGISLWGCGSVSDAGLKVLKGSTKLANLDLDGTKITPEGIKELRDLRELHYIHLANDQITDKMLKGLHEAKMLHALHTAYTKDFKRPTGEDTLYRLSLSKTPITDEGIKELKDLTKIGELELEATNITDAAIPDLKELKSLKRMDLKDTKITDEGFEDLRKTLKLTAFRKPRK